MINGNLSFTRNGFSKLSHHYWAQIATFPDAKSCFLIKKKKSNIFLCLFAKCFLTTLLLFFLDLPKDKWPIGNWSLPIVHLDRMKNSLLFSILILILKSIPKLTNLVNWIANGILPILKKSLQNKTLGFFNNQLIWWVPPVILLRHQ